ncbi:MAG: hypothetical protein H5U05_11255 [Candidatus Aminicenantes bacterium]|nr:hypothetical protein [Candidatus Aminicenantes bacterium]
MMKTIQNIFNKHFAHWQITLPEENVRKKESGYIQKAGWVVQFCFGKDEKGEYLDYYAAHRMTDDCHVRIYENGQAINLPALVSFRRVSQDPEEDKKLEEEYFRYNRGIAQTLIDKGFDKFSVNMFLHAGLDKEKMKNEK